MRDTAALTSYKWTGTIVRPVSNKSCARCGGNLPEDRFNKDGSWHSRSKRRKYREYCTDCKPYVLEMEGGLSGKV